MPRFSVLFTQVVSISVAVEADTADAAIDLAYEEAPGSFCAQCSGWDRPWSRDDAGELEFEEVTDEEGETVQSSRFRWQRGELPPPDSSIPHPTGYPNGGAA